MTDAPLYVQSAMPVFQNRLYDSPVAARACPTGDIRLIQDPVTGLIRNARFQPERMTYDAQYQNEQGLSPTFRRHMDSVLDLLERHMGRTGLVEIGCGKGMFMDLMAARRIEAQGFDPAYEGNDPRIRKAYFTPETGLSAQGIILRHVLEHVPDPVAFLADLAAANGGGGLIYIEVPCFDWIIAHRTWFDIFYEHANYFRLADFSRMFGRILHAGRGFGGQYLTVIADLATLRRPRCDPDDRVTLPADFMQGLADAGADKGPVVVWGGSSKGVVYALLQERAGRRVDRVIDINPAKQGGYLPCTGHRVLSPSDGLSDLPDRATIHIMNPNYEQEIRAIAGPRFQYKVMKHG